MKYKFEIEHNKDILDIFWIDSKKIPKIEERVHVHAFIFNNKDEILLVYFPNKRVWQLPGGKLEKGEKVKDCLYREVDEEADVEIKDLRFYGYLKATSRKSKTKDFGLRFIARIDKIKKQTHDPCEKILTKRKFVKPEKVLDYLKWGENGKLQLRKALENLKKTKKSKNLATFPSL